MLSSHVHLPLGLLASHEFVQDFKVLFKTGQPGSKLLLDLRLVIAQLGVKVLSVRGCAHGGTEDGLDEEGVVGLEGVAVGGAERGA